MKKEWRVGTIIESNTEYFATENEYHVYETDTVKMSDDRYIALRANDTKDFNAFVVIKDKVNVTIDFGGATLIMHGKIQPFLVDSSVNVTVKNCIVTYDRPPFTEATFVEVTPEYSRLRLNENCPCRIEDGMIIPYSDTWETRNLNIKGCFYQVFDPETCRGCGMGLGVMGNHIELDPDWPFHPRQFTVEADGDCFILKGNQRDYYKPGRVLNIAHEARSLSNFFVIDSKNITLNNYRILAGWGMGFYTYRTENITLDGFCLTHDETSPCIVTNAADALHSFGTSGNFVIRNSVFEGMIDDAINIHSNFRTVEHVSGNEIYTHLASCEPEANDLYKVGDKIAVYRGKTMEEAAQYTILKVESITETIKKFTVDCQVLSHNEGDLIENLTTNCDVLIENCAFRKANSHLRLQSRGKFVIRNCECELMILLSGDANYWFESGPLTDLTVENCRFVGDRGQVYIISEVEATDKAPYYHRNLKFLNNEFDTDTPIFGGAADGIIFKGNVNTRGLPMTLSLKNCGNVDAEGCTVENKAE